MKAVILAGGLGARIDGDKTSWEHEPLSNLAKDGQLSAFHYSGFWQPCDTLRDKRVLESLWATGAAPCHQSGN